MMRFRVRTLVCTILIAALMLGGLRTWRLSKSYRERAEYRQFAESLNWYMAWLARTYPDENERRAVIGTLGRVSFSDESRSPLASVQECERAAEQHAAMRRKYERASRYPWLSVGVDAEEVE